MNLKKLLNSAVRTVKNNPEKALVIATLIAPGVVGRVAPKVVPAIVALGKKDRPAL